MSSLGQLSTRLDRRLQVVGELTKALLALRAELTGKLDVLKLTTADVEGARKTITEFLTKLTAVLKGAPPASDDQRVFLAKLAQSGEPLADWAEDFGKFLEQLQARTPVESALLDKVMRVVGFLQGGAAEYVRRLGSRRLDTSPPRTQPHHHLRNPPSRECPAVLRPPPWAKNTS